MLNVPQNFIMSNDNFVPRIVLIALLAYVNLLGTQVALCTDMLYHIFPKACQLAQVLSCLVYVLIVNTPLNLSLPAGLRMVCCTSVQLSTHQSKQFTPKDAHKYYITIRQIAIEMP